MQNKKGFTLLELSLVLAIIALIAAMGVAGALTVMDTAKEVSTQNKLDVIEKALLNFSRTRGRLPCPANISLDDTDTQYGVEAAIPGTCIGGTPTANYFVTTKNVEGGVPVATLGLPKEFVFDGWGRRIVYAATPAFTAINAFRDILPQAACTTAINITDAAGATRSSGAAYMLLSYGPNGHGGYLVKYSGTRMNAGSTNTSEQTNCHCTVAAVNTTTTGNYVQAEALQLGTVAAFDDIVRYKERWQLATLEDTLSDKGYRGPTLAVGFAKAASAGSVYIYKPNCGGWTTQTALATLPTISSGNSFVGFTANNQHLLTYSETGCGLYKIIGASTPILQASTIPNCPTYNITNAVALSNNGYLAISANSTTVKLSRQAGDAFLTLSDLTVAAIPTALSFARNADYLANSTDGNIYRRSGNSFAILGAGTPTGMPPSPTTVAFSPDGKYYAAVKTSTVYLWRVPTNDKPLITDFAALTSLTPGGSTALTGVTFSPDGQYMAVGRAETPYLLLYKIDPGDTFTPVTITSTGIPSASTGLGFSFSSDSSFVAMTTANTNLPVGIFHKTGTLAYTYMASPLSTSVATSTGSSVAFAR